MVLYPGPVGIWREPGEKRLEQGKNQRQTQPTYDTAPELNTGHNVGRQALSPLCLPCSPKLPRRVLSDVASWAPVNCVRLTLLN